MSDYYKEQLNSNKLRQCYQLAPDRIKQYMAAEAEYVKTFVDDKMKVLELGCGYGRFLKEIYSKQAEFYGIDNSEANIAAAIDLLESDVHLAVMNAVELGFPDDYFDLVACIQNGISAFHVDIPSLITEAIRVTRPGGMVLFSTYSDKIWEDRLEWFKLQSQAGLIGEIDLDKTGEGNIVCLDGFTATTITPKQFDQYLQKLNISYH